MVAGSISRMERANPRKVKALTLTILSSLPAQIREALLEALKEKNKIEECLRGMETQFKTRYDRTLCFMDRIWFPMFVDIRILVLEEAQKPRYSVHPGAHKMYLDINKKY